MAKRYVYCWADGIHLEARLEDQAQCILAPRVIAAKLTALPEAGIYAVMINEVSAENVSGKPAKRKMQILQTSGWRPVRSHDDFRTMQFSHHF